MQFYRFFSGFMGKCFKGDILMVTKKVILGVWENNYVILHAEEGEVDSRYIEVSFKDEVFNNLDLSGKSVTFYAQKPDKTQFFNVCTVNTTTNTATVELTSEALNMPGVLNCEFQIFDSNNVLLKVGGLKVVVDSEIDFSDAQESSSSADVITVIMNSIGDLRELTTTEKSSLVGAVNELDSRVVPISKGGTGAETAVAARTNLEVLKGYSLYHNSSGTQSTVVLSDNISNYSLITIHFKDDGGVSNSVTFLADGLSAVNLTSVTIGYGSAKSYNKNVQLNFTQNTITWNQNKALFIFKSGETPTSEMGSNYLKIIKVVGYKY